MIRNTVKHSSSHIGNNEQKIKTMNTLLLKEKFGKSKENKDHEYIASERKVWKI